MTAPDFINGAFEAFGGWFIVMNIRQLLKDKQVKGIHWGSTIFFTSWGLWNCFYYPHLGQWASFAGGLFIALANVVWLVLRIRYSRRPRATDDWRTVLRRVVDYAWNEATESTTVPSTKWADEIIDRALKHNGWDIGPGAA